MKPAWSEAPEWAQWLAQDADGSYWWYKEKPMVGEGTSRWLVRGLGRQSHSPCGTGVPNTDWKSTLEARPDPDGPPWHLAPEGATIACLQSDGQWVFGDHEDAEPTNGSWLGRGKAKRGWMFYYQGKPSENWQQHKFFRNVEEEPAPPKSILQLLREAT